VLLLPITLAVMGIIVLVPVLPQLMAHFEAIPNYKYLIQGGVLTMPALCVMMFSPAAGWLADRFGRRRLLILAMVLYALLGICPLLLDDLYAIIASRVGVGACESVVVTVSTTLISDYFKGADREKWLASQTAVASASSLVLIYISGLLGATYGWRGPFAIYVFSLILAAGIWLLTWEPTPDSRAERVAADMATQGAAKFPWGRMSGICVVTLFASIMFYTVQTQSSLALNSLGIRDPAKLGLLTAIACVGVLVGTLIFRLLARFALNRLLALEFLIIGAGFMSMGKAGNSWQFVVGAAMNQIGCGMILPTLLTWATRGLQFEFRGRGNGTWQATFALGQFLSGMVVTLLGDTVGGILPAFFFLGVANAAAAVISGLARARPGASVPAL